MTRHRKIYLALLTLACVGLLLDKTVLRPTGPEPSAASQAAPHTSSPSVTPVDPAPVPEGSSSTIDPVVSDNLSFLSRLARSAFASSDDTQSSQRDLFSPEPSYLDAVTPPPPEPQPDEIARQQQRLSLQVTGLAAWPGGACAFIHNQVLFPGQSIHGWKLVEIRQHGVVLQKHDQRLLVLCEGYDGFAAKPDRQNEQ